MADAKDSDTKTQALRSLGALNPRPDRVEDERFGEGGFFDRRDLVQVRYEMLRRVRIEDCSISETAASFGVSRPTYYKVHSDFEREGMAGLVPRKRGPKGGHKLTALVVAALHDALVDDPTLDSAALTEMASTRFGVQVHPRSVERALGRFKKKPQ
jgi:transposase